MKKRIFLILYIIIIFCELHISFVYARTEEIYIDKAYINGILINSYPYSGYQRVIAENLRNYGFDVTWDAEKKTLNIHKISNSFPIVNATKIQNFYKEKKAGTVFEKRLFEDVRIADYRVIIDGIDLEYYNPYFTKDGTLIPTNILGRYGSFKKIEGETDYYYITFSKNYPTVTAPNGTEIKVTQPVYDYAKDVLFKEVNPDTSIILGTYVYIKEPHLSGIQDIGNGYYGGYGYLLSEDEVYVDAAILNELNLQYTILNNKLTILSVPSKEISLQYQTIIDFGKPPFDPISGEYRPNEIAELSCVDLKLFSNETEIKTENKFPSFLDYNGNLVIKLQDLAEALHMNFKKEVTSNGSELYYKMTPKQ